MRGKCCEKGCVDGRADQVVMKVTFASVCLKGKGEKGVSTGGISLKVVTIVKDGLLNVETNWSR